MTVAEPPRGLRADAVLLTPETPLVSIEAFVAGVGTAFGTPAAASWPAEVAQLRHDLGEGSTLAAVALAHGAIVAGASLVGIGDVAELVGVWTAPAQRRRGLASAVCATLLAAFFARGGELAWLSAADRASASLYRRLGFVECGTQLNYGLLLAPILDVRACPLHYVTRVVI